jgi:hypothetical protein
MVKAIAMLIIKSPVSATDQGPDVLPAPGSDPDVAGDTQRGQASGVGHRRLIDLKRL